MLTDRDISILRFVNQFGSITINQAHMLFYNNASWGRDLARKRLKHISKMGGLKSTRNNIRNTLVYYINKPASAHSLYIMDFYSKLLAHGAEIMEFKKEYAISNLRSDALFKFDYKGSIAICFVEVVITNQVDFSKYEALKGTGELQRIYGTFPAIIVISNCPKQYKGSKLNVRYLDYKMLNFNQVILP